MSRTYDDYGVQKIEMGAVGDGIMGGSLSLYENIVENSLEIIDEEPGVKHVHVEDDRGQPYRTFSDGQSIKGFRFKLYGVTGAQEEILRGGAWNDSDQYTFPTDITDIYLSVKITSMETDKDGKGKVWYIPYGKITAKRSGNLTYNDIAVMEVEVIANMPVATDGTKGDPIYYKIEVLTTTTTTTTTES